MEHKERGIIVIPTKTIDGFEQDYKISQKEIDMMKSLYPPEVLVRVLLEHLGEDPTREGLIDTPKRWVKWMREFLSPQPFKMTSFSAEGCDEMVIVDNIPFYSFCEHHIAPIVGYGHIAYIPGDKIVGLSKLPRVLDFFSHRLQNQERITSQVADYIQEHMNPKGVAVSLTARHFCMEMRGVKKHDTWTTTTKLLGAFKENPEVKKEFLTRIQSKK